MKWKNALLILSASLGLVPAAWAEKLSVAATPVPHAEILEYVKPMLAKEGVELEVRVFTDYVQPNIQVAQKRMDANFFQHKPYLDEFNKDRGTDLVAVAGVHIEPFGAYSRRIKKLDELKEGAVVAIPNDPTNGGRALLLLQRAGLIRLKDPGKITATPRDIADNPKRLGFKELEAATPAAHPRPGRSGPHQHQLCAGGRTQSHERRARHRGGRFALRERAGGPAGQQGRRGHAKLVRALHSEAVKRFILEKYQGAVVPAF